MATVVKKYWFLKLSVQKKPQGCYNQILQHLPISCEKALDPYLLSVSLHLHSPPSEIVNLYVEMCL